MPTLGLGYVNRESGWFWNGNYGASAARPGASPLIVDVASTRKELSMNLGKTIAEDWQAFAGLQRAHNEYKANCAKNPNGQFIVNTVGQCLSFADYYSINTLYVGVSKGIVLSVGKLILNGTVGVSNASLTSTSNDTASPSASSSWGPGLGYSFGLSYLMQASKNLFASLDAKQQMIKPSGWSDTYSTIGVSLVLVTGGE